MASGMEYFGTEDAGGRLEMMVLPADVTCKDRIRARISWMLAWLCSMHSRKV